MARHNTTEVGVPEETGGVRDHLANEHTQLAWLRTGANVMVVGLAVARFADDGRVSVSSLAAGCCWSSPERPRSSTAPLRYRRVAEQLRRGGAATAARSAGPSVVAVLLLACIAAAVLLVSV